MGERSSKVATFIYFQLLTPEADDDLLGVARYTIKTWGEEQTEHYAGMLRSCFQAIGRGKARPRELLKTRPELLVIRCEHHYVFYRLRKGQSPLIIAVHRFLAGDGGWLYSGGKRKPQRRLPNWPTSTSCVCGNSTNKIHIVLESTKARETGPCSCTWNFWWIGVLVQLPQ